LFKTTALGEKASLQFRAEAFNLLNHTNYGTPNAVVYVSQTVTQGGVTTTQLVNSPAAGLVTATATPSRQIQFGLKLTF